MFKVKENVWFPLLLLSLNASATVSVAPGEIWMQFGAGGGTHTKFKAVPTTLVRKALQI